MNLFTSTFLPSPCASRPSWPSCAKQPRGIRARKCRSRRRPRLAAGEAGTYDFAFVDADKPAYAAYYDRLLKLLRPGGLIAFDNTLGTSGIPFTRQQDTPNAKAIFALNEQLRDDPRIDLSMLTLGEGLTLARKRPVQTP